MSTATLERFPKTVSACHAEIIRLRKAMEESDPTRISELEAERDELKGQLATAQDEIDGLEERIEELEEAEHPDVIEAVDQFLYEVERPVGQFKFDVIHGPAAGLAILRLFDAVGRQP
jgi:predicted nuclease with TOPRIM domain